MSDRPTVAHLIRTFLWPTETFVINQIRTLDRYHPIVACRQRRSYPEFPAGETFSTQETLPTLPRLIDAVNYQAGKRMPRSSARAIEGFLGDHDTSILHFHYLVYARYFAAIRRMTGLPAVVSAYGYDVSSFPRTRFGLGAKYLEPIFGEMDCFIAMSDDMRRDLVRIGCPEEKIVVHYHGIDTDRFAYPERTYPDRDRVNILLCGRIEPKKAHAEVLRALHLWEQRTPRSRSFEVTVMGSGPLREPLEQLVENYGWQDRVRLLGHVPHGDQRLVEEYRRADIFAQPSVTADGEKEGIPGTVVEAMACGLPVVSTYHAGIPELISDGEDGLLVPEGDLTELSAALGSLIEDRSLRERLGRAAAATASTRGRIWARTPHLERIYDEVASGTRCTSCPAGRRPQPAMRFSTAS